MVQLTNKKEQLSKFRADMLNKSLTMFEWQNLPDTLPAVEIEKQLQMTGFTIIAKVNGNVYAFQGGFSGQDPYGRPTTAIVNNPSLQYNGTFTIDEDCVVIKNDDMQQGLIHIFNKYGTLLIENQITMLMTDYNYRMPFTISSKDDSTTQSAQEFLNKIIDGSLGVIGEAKLFDALSVTPTNNKGVNSFADLYGYQQFIEAELNNTIGLATNNNMKRERLTTNEIEVNKNASYPLIDNMLRNRQEAADKINKMFDLDITVDFSSIWNGNNESEGEEDNGNNGNSSDNADDVTPNGGYDVPTAGNKEPTENDERIDETQPETQSDNSTDKERNQSVEKEDDKPAEDDKSTDELEDNKPAEDDKSTDGPEDNKPAEDEPEDDDKSTDVNDDVDKKSTDDKSTNDDDNDQSNDDDDKKDKKGQ